MILVPIDYHLIVPANTFTQPPNSDFPFPNPVDIAAQIASAEDTNRLTKKLYLETILLERTIVQQIIEAVDTKYLAALHNTFTGQITPLVPTILDFLHNNYRRITPQQLDYKTTAIKLMTYDPDQPINIIFNSIDDLVKYARAAEAELNQS